MELEFSMRPTEVEGIGAQCERLLLAFRDVPSTYDAMRELVAFLARNRDDGGRAGWRSCVDVMRDHELGRLLRTDPMVRRCQWRAPGTDPQDIVEAFVREWDDASESLLEAEESGQIINAAIVAGPLGAAIRERRDGVRSFILNTVRRGFRPSILALGAGRASEADIFAAGDHLSIESWTVVDEGSADDASLRRRAQDFPRRHVARPADFLASAPTDARFDLIYTTDALDEFGDDAAIALLSAAAGRLKPNGRLLVSSLAPSLREAGYMDAVLDWRPAFRDERALSRILASLPSPVSSTQRVWNGASGGVVFGVAELKTWAD